MKQVSGGVGAGCGTFSLLGILLGVGITAFLGAQVMGDLGGSSTGKDRVAASQGLFLSPIGTVRDGQKVQVTSNQLPADMPVVLSSCLNLDHDPLASGEDAPRCDPNTQLLARTDKTHHLKVTYMIKRTLDIDSVALDCAIQPGQCILQAVAVNQPPGAKAGTPLPSVMVLLTVAG